MSRRLKIAAEPTRSWYLWPVVCNIETAIRGHLGLRWEHIDQTRRQSFAHDKEWFVDWVPQDDNAVHAKAVFLFNCD